MAVKMPNQYSAADIVILKWNEAVQRRVGMYLDLTQERVGNVLVKEALCHAIEELVHQRATRVRVELFDDRITVEDDGMGWSGETGPEMRQSPLEAILTSLHAGCRRHHTVDRIRKEICRGSVAALNALSTTMTATSWHDGRAWRIRYAEGFLQDGLTRVEAPSQQGLILDFMPSEQFSATPGLRYRRAPHVVGGLGFPDPERCARNRLRRRDRPAGAQPPSRTTTGTWSDPRSQPRTGFRMS